MTVEKSLETAVSGSFKFKPEIDALHEEFEDYGVLVLEPSIGWLWLPRLVTASSQFRPLPSEVGQNIREIEDRFLAAIDQADFLYVYNEESYLGVSTAFEMGYATSRKKPIYAKAPIDFFEFADYDLGMKAFLEETIVIAKPSQVVVLETARREANLQAL